MEGTCSARSKWFAARRQERPGILALGMDGKKPATAGRDGQQVTLVAGIGFEPMTFRL
jgi:hypothetical protein